MSRLHTLAPAATLVLAMALLSFLVPTSDALWAKVLTISGRVTTREFQGCTPGYWKQEQHFDSWPAPYAPDTSFDDVFDRDAPGNRTLLEALELMGGGINALMRQATAALLNAAHPEVAYAFSVDEVIAKFQAAFDSGEYEATKDEFEAANESFCPLNDGDKGKPDQDDLRREELIVPDEGTPTPTPTAAPVDTAAPSVTPTATASPTPISTNSATPTQAATTATPTATPEPPRDTATPESPTYTPSPEPSDTPAASPTAEPTATPTPGG